jgi:hypothetical protein
MPLKADRVLDLPETSVLDVLDHVLNKGVLASGDVTLGVAGIDLIYLRLSAILAAADRVLPPGDPMVKRQAPRGSARPSQPNRSRRPRQRNRTATRKRRQ